MFFVVGATDNGVAKDEKKMYDFPETDNKNDEEEAGEEYVVDKVLKRRCSESGKIYCLVKWLGYPKEYNTWEPEQNLLSVGKYDEFISWFSKRQHLVREYRCSIFLLFIPVISSDANREWSIINSNYERLSKSHVNIWSIWRGI